MDSCAAPVGRARTCRALGVATENAAHEFSLAAWSLRCSEHAIIMVRIWLTILGGGVKPQNRCAISHLRTRRGDCVSSAGEGRDERSHEYFDSVCFDADGFHAVPSRDWDCPELHAREHLARRY